MSEVLIVGAASDIGRAVARAYAKAGRNVALAARRAERLDADIADLNIRWDVAARRFEFDILDTASHAALLDALGELPETVVLVVGLLGEQHRAAADAAEAERLMRTNYLAPALFLGEVANRMERRGRGTIVGLCSVAGDRGRGSNYLYGSAKAGLSAMLSGLRNRLARSGVHVVTVKPGFVATAMTEGMRLPPLLTAQPEEVAATIIAAERRRRDIVYVRPVWRLVMLAIRLLPERVFKRLSL